MVLLALKTSMMTTVPKALSAPFKQRLIVVFTLVPFPQTVYSDSQNNVPLSKCWQGSYGFAIKPFSLLRDHFRLAL